MKRKTKKCPKCEEAMLLEYNTCPACGFCGKKDEGVYYASNKEKDKKEIEATCPSCSFKFNVSH